ncbi:MAG: PIN domain-containing protein [Bacillota bacterium]
MKKVLVDSDVIIAHLRGDHRALSLLRPLLADGLAACSALTVIEVQSGVRDCGREKQETDGLFAVVEVLSLGKPEAELAGGLIRDKRSTGLTVGLVDAAIAATCLVHGYNLLTFNVRHFKPLGVSLLSGVG